MALSWSTEGLAHGAGLAIGVFLLVLAFLVHRASPDRDARGFLALHLLLVGANYVLMDGGWVLSLFGVDRAPWRAASLVPLVLDPAPLLLFAFALAHGRPPLRGTLVAFLPSALLLVALLAVPAPTTSPAWFAFLGVLVAYYALAFLLLVRAYRAAGPTPRRDRLGILVVAFGVVVLPRLALVWADSLGSGLRVLEHPYVLAYVGQLAVLFGLAALLLLRGTREGARAHAAWTLRALGAMLLVVAAVWLFAFVPGLEATARSLLYAGRWFLFAGILAIGVRRHGLLDLPDEAGRRLERGLAFAAALLVLSQLASLLDTSQGAPHGWRLADSLLVVAAAALVYGAFRFVLPRASSEIVWRRMRVYRAHVELGAPEEELSALRERLGLGVREAREIRRLVDEERAVTQGARRASLAEGALLLGRYEVGPLAGAGSFGRIYEARDRVAGERVVLKELLPAWQEDSEALARFRREAQTALRVEHPHLVAFRGLERIEGGHVLILQHVEGETLRQRLARGPLASAEAAALAADALSGLSALHRLGIVHRDVKPENVMLRPGGRAVLLDFGAVMAGPASRGTRAAGGAHPGTPGYMSPEQARGGPVGPESDLYALGVVLWEALSGRPPPEGSVPSGWEAVLSRALDPDPARRWAGAEAFRDALRALPR